MTQTTNLERTVTNLHSKRGSLRALTPGKKPHAGLLVVVKRIPEGRGGIKTTNGIKVRVTGDFRFERISKLTKLDRSIYSTVEISRVSPYYKSRPLTLLRSERYFP